MVFPRNSRFAQFAPALICLVLLAYWRATRKRHASEIMISRNIFFEFLDNEVFDPLPQGKSAALIIPFSPFFDQHLQ
jgi:hypothetical protein